MNVLIVSQCAKNALKETRRILDQFAERRGDRTWQTPITQAGLDTLRKLLRRRARRNTAVACHWIRGRDHSELLWIVGDASRFNRHGAVPTNTTRRNILRSKDENDWHNGDLIRLLASAAALFHDLGKASQAFQLRLSGKLEGRNRYRHEWVSLRLFEAFVGTDEDAAWLARLQSPTASDDRCWLERLQRDGLDTPPPATPFQRLPPLAAAIGWLILSHHRLPLMPEIANGVQQPLGKKISHFNADSMPDLPADLTAGWNEVVTPGSRKDLSPYWNFPHGLPVTTPAWRARSKRISRQLAMQLAPRHAPVLDDPFIMHLARLCLMLADHHYSSLTTRAMRLRGEKDYPLYANTAYRHGERQLCQPLDEHLLGVTREVGEIAHRLPDMLDALARVRHKGFRQRSKQERFRWQDRAFDLAASLRERSREQGFFGVNMASTGCGKTLANGRIIYALAEPDQGARFAIALGLRTLTLQTGKAYRDTLGLGADELAIRVGGGATRTLFERKWRQAEASGSASSQPLLDDDSRVHFAGSENDHPLLARVVANPGARALISAPILVCTIDHLMPATESLRGGHQIAPMLRLMSGDLILDEPDDFDLADLPALTRLVHWAGMLGSRVLLSSATLPPALIAGLFDAYRSGRQHYQRNRGEPGKALDICCAWFDEADRQHQDCAERQSFEAAHAAFARQRHQRLSTAEVRRRARREPVDIGARDPEQIRYALATQLRDHALGLHRHHHSLDPHSQKRVSFGLIRMANIEPLIEVALALYRQDAPANYRIHLCVYHAQFPVLIRSNIEAQLDQALDRRDEYAVFESPSIRQRIDDHEEPDQLFIVLGSPVTEVGRDHDYDWAVVEPSSMRSLIQLAGRVRRHRQSRCIEANIVVLDTNLKHLEHPGEPAFCRPGFEAMGEWKLLSHSLSQLLSEAECRVIDARPRIVPHTPLSPQQRLVDLEHARLNRLLILPERQPTPPPPADPAQLSPRQRRRLSNPPPTQPLGAYSWYGLPRVTLSGVLQQQQRFRLDPLERVELVLMPDEEGENYQLMQVFNEPGAKPCPKTIDQAKLTRIDDQDIQAQRITPWGEVDYLQGLNVLAEELEIEPQRCAEQFGTVHLAQNMTGWKFHPALGFVRKK